MSFPFGRSIVWLSFVFCLLPACASQAQPAGRVIVQFVAPVEVRQQEVVRELLLEHDVPVLELAESSHARRWILVLPPSLSREDTETLIDHLSQLPFVEFAEADSLLQPIR